ncbi:hypothetical protein ADIS_3041 [Lunatimonas lonarensis]|uniref:3-keto-alpha-glucoside-1,2-lyase/3-keto-2-hydroxy-glucal hydratase domain-containing protein n=1 Tax=Lunatimonas lonarensis TaxID=1232681 RepID=R7ZR47_9BACT|nr:DUF1080 domain-containing protein [Lunatimonas lonarensis]EON76591.1 hypothetical protein ADIS_3041 [Lunatimonas lonarensis]
MTRLYIVFFTLAWISCAGPQSQQAEINVADGWRTLFNGKDLENWRIKIAKHELDENFANTFRVEDGLMKVRYDGYEAFDRQYGHIFYDEPFSYYLYRVEYRFVGEQAPEGEGWALRNSGVMLHGQKPETMTKDQDFPISIEGQLLGGDGTNNRTTSNLCTPGTNVVIDDELFTPHCLNSSSKTYHGEQWVVADFLVLGDSIIHHILEGDTVLTYHKPQMGGGNVSNHNPDVKKDGQLISEGYISLQSESHPIDFRRVEIFDLSGYQAEGRLEEALRALRKAEGY